MKTLDKNWTKALGTDIYKIDDCVILWPDSYDKVVDFIATNKKNPSCTSKDLEEAILGRWCARQRGDKRSNKLSEERLEALNNIHGWIWSLWIWTYDKVIEFTKDNNKIPSTCSKNPEEKKLGIWCSTQRYNKKNNKLSEDRIKALENIPGWWWGLSGPQTDAYNEVVTFVEDNNKFPSMCSKDLEEKRLGVWCSRQRSYKRKNKLLEERIQALESIPGWLWSLWGDLHNQVINFIKNNNKIPSTCSKDSEESRLGNWCSTQRNNKRDNKLSKERINALENTPVAQSAFF